MESMHKIVFGDLRELYNNKEIGDTVFQVYLRGKTVIVSWDLIFRRNTRVGAYKEHQRDITAANQVIRKIADQYRSTTTLTEQYCDLESCKSGDDLAEVNNGSAYSEYEQAIGGSVQLHL